MTVLLTGAAGFIGSQVGLALLAEGRSVLGIDNLNDYYDPELKQARLALFEGQANFVFQHLDITDRAAIMALAESHPDIDLIVHLAAQAGVRYSLQEPYRYVESNVEGQLTMMELARRLEGLQHFVYASSSSVYGGNEKTPYAVDDPVERPVSLYAATKRAGELMAHTYAHLYQIPMTGLRFFTVYGPWGRPDMAPSLFAKAILEGRPIQVFNHGKMERDFTYIDDIVSGVLAACVRPPSANDDKVPWQLYNLGNNQTVMLEDFIAGMERACGREAIKDYRPMQPGDVPKTYADIEKSRQELSFEPTTSIDEGLPRFVAWFRDYYGV